MKGTEHFDWQVPEDTDQVDIPQHFGVIFRDIDARLFALAEKLSAQEESAEDTALRVDAAEAKVQDYEARIARLEDALYTNVTANPFQIRFDSLDGLVVTGVWNAARQRMEC